MSQCVTVGFTSRKNYSNTATGAEFSQFGANVYAVNILNNPDEGECLILKFGAKKYVMECGVKHCHSKAQIRHAWTITKSVRVAPSDDLRRVASSVAKKLGFTVSKREKLVPYTRYVAFLDSLRARNPAQNNPKSKPLREANTALNDELDRLRTVEQHMQTISDADGQKEYCQAQVVPAEHQVYTAMCALFALDSAAPAEVAKLCSGRAERLRVKAMIATPYPAKKTSESTSSVTVADMQDHIDALKGRLQIVNQLVSHVRNVDSSKIAELMCASSSMYSKYLSKNMDPPVPLDIMQSAANETGLDATIHTMNTFAKHSCDLYE